MNLAAGLDLPSIAFCGKAGSGKTTAAEMLAELGYVRRGHADPLKEVAETLWPGGVTRERLQVLGRDIRALYEDTFVDLLMMWLASRACSAVAVDDLRYPNEYWALKGQGFVIVRVTAPRHVRVNRLKANGRFENEEQLGDESETALDDPLIDVDYVIVNTGTKGDLHSALIDILAKELKQR